MRTILKKILSPVLQKASAIYLSKPRKYKYKDISIWVEPGVFPPFITISTKLLLQFIEGLPLQNKTFLELGCGSGILSILAARKGAFVTATDINETAINALHKNALENNVSLDIRYSDLFENLTGATFDYIIINPPYYPKTPTNTAESAWYCGDNFEYFESLFKQIPNFINNQNKIYMILSEDCNINQIMNIASKNNLVLKCVRKKSVFKEMNYIYSLEKEY